MNSATSSALAEGWLWRCRNGCQVGDGAKRERFGRIVPLLLLTIVSASCASTPSDYTLYSGHGNDDAQGPWARFPGVALSKVDLDPHDLEGALNADLLKAMAEEVLRLDGAAQCEPTSRRPIPNISTEYCSALYVANTALDDERPQYELRLTIPRRNRFNPERSCFPPKAVRDADFPARWIIIIGLIHNHPCGHGPSTRDIETWPVDFDPTQGMARLDLYPGNAVSGTAPTIQGVPLIVQSYIFAKRGDRTILLLLRTTGDIHQWDGHGWEWRAKCEPSPSGNGPARCNPPFKLHEE